MTDKQLAEIEARAEATSPGVHGPGRAEPWRVFHDFDMFVGTTHGVLTWYGFIEVGRDNRQNVVADTEFIGHAKQDIKALAAEIRRLKGEQ